MKVERLIDTKDMMVKRRPLLILKNNYVVTHDAKGLHKKTTELPCGLKNTSVQSDINH